MPFAEMDSPLDIKVSDVVDWMLFRLPPMKRLYTRDEVVDLLLDLRNEFD